MKIRFYPNDVLTGSPRDKLIASMKTTAVSRYNASNRLARHSKITFWASTLFSLGLIFIPLMQLSGAPLKLSGNILSAIQIFFAVSILVYSIIIGTARFQLRSEQLNDCGDNIKKLIRDLRIAKTNDDEEESSLLKESQEKYAAITTDVENHERSDYLLAILRSQDLFDLTWYGRFFYWLKYIVSALPPYAPPIMIVLIEIFLITDMFGITNIFSPYLNG